MNVFYIQNEKQFKKLIYCMMTNNNIYFGENLCDLYLLGCDYIEQYIGKDEGFNPYDNNCNMCDESSCLLFGKHVNDRGVLNHMYITQDIEYPTLLILCYTPYDSIIKCVPVREAKENMKNL